MKVEEVKPNIASSMTSSRQQTHGKFVSTCHHCGVVGHIRPNCWRLKAAPKKEDHATAPTCQGKKCMNSLVKHHASYPCKFPSKRFIPSCHHCGKLGHIQPKCFQLKPQ